MPELNVSNLLGPNELFTTSLISDANLKAYYRLENENDYTANVYHLTNNNTVTFSAGKFNNAANFGTSNTNKSLTISNNLGIDGGNISICALVKLSTEIGSGYYSIVSQQSTTSKVKNAIMYNYNSGTRRLEFWRVKNGVAVDGPTYTITLGTSNWYYLVYTYDGTNVRGYVNGVLVGTGASSGNGSAAAASFLDIAQDESGRYYSGLIDDVSVFNRVLTAAEISQLYGVIAYYRMESGALTTDTKGGVTLTNTNTVGEAVGKFSGGADGGSSNTNKRLGTTSNFGIVKNDNRTISCWIKMNTELSGSDTYPGAVSMTHSSGQVSYVLGYYRISSVNKVFFERVRGGVGGESFSTNVNLGTSNWHHLVLTYSSPTLTGYLDGVSFGSVTCNTGDGTSGYTGGTYALWNDSANYLSAIIDDVAIFNRALSETEVKILFTETKINRSINLQAVNRSNYF